METRTEDQTFASKPGKSWWPGMLLAVAVLVLGLVLQPLRIIGWEFRNLPGDLFDAHFNLCVLEHGWQWLSGDQPRFWDAPFFYPEPNVIAYSDCHLGTLPLFALFRLAGGDRETAFQGWFISLFVLNYFACLWCLRRFKMSWLGASVGAYVFSFGLPVMSQQGHCQLLPRFTIPVAAYFAVRVCRGAGAWNWLGLGLCVVWQFYATIYDGYFLLLFLAAFIPSYAAIRWRTELLAYFRRAGWAALVLQIALVAGLMLSARKQQNWWWVAVICAGAFGCWRYRELYWRAICGGSRRQVMQRGLAIALCAVAVIPLMYPYYEAFKWCGPRPVDEIISMLPRPQSWILPNPHALFWGWLWDSIDVPMKHEHKMFLGLLPCLALLLALACIFRPQRNEGRYLAGASALAVIGVALVTLYTGTFSLYEFFATWPGVSAVRAVTRVCLVMTFPAAMALAFWLTYLQNRLRTLTGSVLAGAALLMVVPLMAADQFIKSSSADNWSKHDCQERARRVVEEVLAQNPNAKLFFCARQFEENGQIATQQLDAMAAAQLLHIPTLNGYSGHSPIDWELSLRPDRLATWEFAVKDRIGLKRLGRRMPYFGENGFDGLVVLGNPQFVDHGPITRCTVPLADNDTQANLEIGERPSRVPVGSLTRLKLRVFNGGSAVWPALGRKDGAFRIGAGYRWLHTDGSEAVPRNNRHWPESDIAPLTAGEIEVQLRAPWEPGHYIVEIDMVQELVCWFSDRGSPTLRLEVEVVRPGE